MDSAVSLITDPLGSDLLSGLSFHPLNSWLGPDVCIRPIPLLYYTRTIPQRPPSRQRKRGCCREALERWPLWRGRGVIWHLCFFQGCNILIFPKILLYCSIKYITQSKINQETKRETDTAEARCGSNSSIKKTTFFPRQTQMITHCREGDLRKGPICGIFFKMFFCIRHDYSPF